MAVDRDVLAVYCSTLADYAAVTLEIERLDSPVIEDRYGRRIAPQVTAQRNYAELMLKLGGRLGLTPADRTGIRVSRPRTSKWEGKIN